MNIKGNFPDVTLNSRDILEFNDIYFTELRNGTVYFIVYRIGRNTEFGLICDCLYVNRRAGIIQDLDSFCERVFTNTKGSCTIKVADTTKEEFLGIYAEILQNN